MSWRCSPPMPPAVQWPISPAPRLLVSVGRRHRGCKAWSPNPWSPDRADDRRRRELGQTETPAHRRCPDYSGETDGRDIATPAVVGGCRPAAGNARNAVSTLHRSGRSGQRLQPIDHCGNAISSRENRRRRPDRLFYCRAPHFQKN